MVFKKETQSVPLFSGHPTFGYVSKLNCPLSCPLNQPGKSTNSKGTNPMSFGVSSVKSFFVKLSILEGTRVLVVGVPYMCENSYDIYLILATQRTSKVWALRWFLDVPFKEPVQGNQAFFFCRGQRRIPGRADVSASFCVGEAPRLVFPTPNLAIPCTSIGNQGKHPLKATIGRLGKQGLHGVMNKMNATRPLI